MDRGPMMFTRYVSLPKDDKTSMQGKQITAGKLTGLRAQTNANYVAKKGRGSKAWAVRQGKYTEIHMHLLRIIHLEIYIQNISLVLSCESHPKCKLKATDNYIKRTLHKVNNPCTPRYKHRCFIPGGNITSPSLKFLSLNLDIRGLNPQSSITLPLGVATNHLAKVKYGNGEHARITEELKYKREEPNILLIAI